MAGMNIPSGAGGLMRYSEEYKSKFVIDPKYVIAMIIVAILFVIALKVFWPVTSTVSTASTGAFIPLLLKLVR